MAEGATFFSPKKRQKASVSLAELTAEDTDDKTGGAATLDLAEKHVKEKAYLRAVHEEQFYHWLYLLKQGFNLLLYGFGGKHTLLDKFGQDILTDGGVLSVNGQAPSISVRQLLLKCAAMLRLTSAHQSRTTDTHTVMRQLQNAPAELHLYVVLHHIDGLGLRSVEAQGLLAELAACPSIHLIASMDAANTPLLWDKQASARFNFAHFDVTSYAPYGHETALVPSLLLGRRDEQASQGAAVVLKTLTPGARAIFKILAQHQLAGDEADIGMTFAVLFRKCREHFLVSNEIALRAHLSEFRDHRLLQARRGTDGAEEHIIPLDAAVLQQLLLDMEAAS